MPLKQVMHKAVLWGVFVHASFRQKGIARKLLDEILQYARETEIMQEQLTVNTQNARARNFYQKLGFVTYGIEPRAMSVDGRFFDEEHMVLTL